MLVNRRVPGEPNSRPTRPIVLGPLFPGAADVGPGLRREREEYQRKDPPDRKRRKERKERKDERKQRKERKERKERKKRKERKEKEKEQEEGGGRGSWKRDNAAGICWRLCGISFI